jgi:phospholipase C
MVKHALRLWLLLFAVSAFAQVPGITHVVIIVSENQSGDHLCPAFPVGFDCASVGMSAGVAVPLAHGIDPPVANCAHGYSQAKADINDGKMDGFGRYCKIYNHVNQAYTQLYATDIPWLSDLANNAIAGMPTRTADHFFESEPDPSYGAHLFLIAGQDANIIGVPNNGYLSWGCDAPATALVLQKDPTTGKNALVSPCVEVPTIAKLADAAGVSLSVYGALPRQYGYSWVSPDYVNSWRNGPDWVNVHNIANFPADLAQGTLAQITYLIPTFRESGHPLQSMRNNEAWIRTNLEALQASPEWAHTAVFVFWDDWGGYYDHAVPPAKDGLRVPLIVVSPLLTNAGVVDKRVLDFGSVLKFAEVQFGLGCLTAKDCNAHSLAAEFQ